VGEGNGAAAAQSLASKTSDNTKWIAFVCYTRHDDEAYNGAVSKLAMKLSQQLTRFGDGKNANIYLDAVSSTRSQDFREGVKDVFKDIPVFIPVLSTMWFKSPECLWECEQFLIRVHEGEHDTDRWKLPGRHRAMFFPITFESMSALKKAHSTPQTEKLFFAPGQEVGDLIDGYEGTQKFMAITTKLKEVITEWWDDRQWLVSDQQGGDGTVDANKAVSDATNTPLDTPHGQTHGPSLADDLIERHSELLPRAVRLVPPDWTKSMTALDKAATGRLEILDLLLQRLQQGDKSATCERWFGSLGVSTRLGK